MPEAEPWEMGMDGMDEGSHPIRQSLGAWCLPARVPGASSQQL